MGDVLCDTDLPADPLREALHQQIPELDLLTKRKLTALLHHRGNQVAEFKPDGE